MRSPTNFREEQRFTQTWIWALVLGLAALWIAIAGIQLGFGIKVGNNPASDGLLIAIGILPVVVLPLLIGTLRLTVEVRDGALHVRFFPFVRKVIRLSEIRSAEARTYRPILEYGGWGIRWGGRNGWAYNVKGNRGVQLELANGKRLLIGSQKADELAAAITTAAVPGRRA